MIWPWLRALGAQCLVLYVLVNLTIITFVPVLHTVTIDVKVVNVREQPVGFSTVVLEWGHVRPMKAVCNEGGVATFTKTVQQQPWWALPRVGYLNMEGAKVSARHHDKAGSMVIEQKLWFPVYPSDAAISLEIVLTPGR